MDRGFAVKVEHMKWSGADWGDDLENSTGPYTQNRGNYEAGIDVVDEGTMLMSYQVRTRMLKENAGESQWVEEDLEYDGRTRNGGYSHARERMSFVMIQLDEELGNSSIDGLLQVVLFLVEQYYFLSCLFQEVDQNGGPHYGGDNLYQTTLLPWTLVAAKMQRVVHDLLAPKR